MDVADLVRSQVAHALPESGSRVVEIGKILTFVKSCFPDLPEHDISWMIMREVAARGAAVFWAGRQEAEVPEENSAGGSRDQRAAQAASPDTQTYIVPKVA